MTEKIGLDDLLDRQFGDVEGVPRRASWMETTLGVLPFILGALIMSIPQLIVVAGWASWESGYLSTAQNILGLTILLLSLGVLVYAWRRSWPRWTGTWFLLFLILALAPIMFLSTLIEDTSRVADAFPELAAVTLFPLLLAWLLYAVVRHDPIKALLAVIPIVVLIWRPNMEFVPDQIEAPINLASLFLAGLAAVALLRWVNWRPGLWLVILLNALVGLLFAYAGTFHGGTLPFSAPGPSLVEVLKSFTPQFLAVSTIILGPFLAASFRGIGRESGASGALGYHLVLLGMFLALAGVLANFFMVWDDRLFIYQSSLEIWFTVFFMLGLFCYITGVILLGQAAVGDYTLPGWLDYILLVILTLTLPLVLMMPVLDQYAHHSDPLYIFGSLAAQSWSLIASFGVAWLLLTVWLITHRRGRAVEDEQVVKTVTNSHV